MTIFKMSDDKMPRYQICERKKFRISIIYKIGLFHSNDAMTVHPTSFCQTPFGQKVK